MKISLISPIYKGVKELEKLFESLIVQTKKNYEIILIIDTNSENVLSMVDTYKNKLKNKIKVIFNTKRISRTDALNLGFNLAKGKYSIILSTQNEIKKNFVESVSDLITEKKTDIIEFNATIERPIKFKGVIRKSFNESTVISKNPSVHAFTYPFDFNKIYKTEVLKTTTKFTFPTKVNSRFSIEIPIKALLVAETYSTANKTLIVCKSELSKNFNVLQLIKQWETTIESLHTTRNDIDIDRYIYNQYFSQVVIYSAFVKETKNKILSKKFNDRFKKQLDKSFDGIFSNNVFSNTLINERKVLFHNKDVSKFHKVYKELK